MKIKIALVALVATLAVAVAATTAPSAKAQLPIPGATCTNAAGDPVGCTLEFLGFAGGPGGALRAVFQLTNTVTGQVTRVLVPITDITQQQGSCTILELQTGDIDLFLLGLNLHVDPIHLVLTAERGTLLGDLLCGLFFGNPTAGLLNQVVRNGEVALA